MKTEQIHSLTETFEGHAQQTGSGFEYWLARDLQHLLGYAEWENFQTVITKAKTACEVSGHDVGNHFPDVRKMVQIGSSTEREIDDLMLTRYLIATISFQHSHHYAKDNEPHYVDASRVCIELSTSSIEGKKIK